MNDDDDDYNENGGFPEPPHVRPEDYAPPMHLDDNPGSSIRRAQIVTAAVVATGIAVGAIIGIAHAHSGPGPVAAAATTPDPSAPQPAGNINASLDATPFPTITRSPYQLSSLTGQDMNAQQAMLAQQQLQRERDSARMVAMLRAQDQAQQQTVPAVTQASNNQSQSTTSLSPSHGAMTIEQPQSQNVHVSNNEQTEEAINNSPDLQDNSERTATTQSGVVQNLQTQNTTAQHRFLENNEQSTGIGYVQPQSTYQLNPTTVIPARLLSAINSDLPGPVKAQVVQTIYDSRTHATIVIPQGAMLYGIYDSAIVSGQNRLLVAWNEIIFPNGEEFRMGGMPGTDAQGASGFSGDVNKHQGEIYKSAFLLTMLGVAEGALVPQPQSILQAPTISQLAAQNAGAQLTNVGNKVIDQQVQRAPTLTISPPYLFQVFVTKTLPLDAYQG